jgi:hypothetical protein
MFKRVMVLCGALLLTGCGIRPFTLTEYPLRAGLIPPIDITGTARASNNQPSTEQIVITSGGGGGLGSSPNAITEVMTQQTNEELLKNGHSHGGMAAKTISLRVDSLASDYIAWYWSSEIKFTATLGDGETVDFDVHHSSGVLEQDIDGCIAEGVMHLLNDPRVRAYLAK